MSGILGVWSSQQITPWEQMLQDLQVLGPDGSGDWHGLNGQLSLGRTQFFDTPESLAEPPVIEYQGCVLVWDGRIDDRESLLGRHTRSVTDGELLIESYRRWGIDCIDRLIGEFAFILWDGANDTLVVGCDPMGRRSIAYAWDGQTLMIASRVLSLLLHPQISSELDPLYLANTLCNLGSYEFGSTPFKAVRRLQSGHALILRAGQFKEQQIAELTSPKHYDKKKSPQTYYDEFWHLLDKSVKDRTRTIHRPCTTLSGGLDSTIVTASLLNHLPQIDSFSTVTSVFPEFDEREPIQAFLNRYPQTTWHPINSDHAWSLSENWEHLPVPDDPIYGCTLPMNIRLMQEIQQQGFGTIFDGEWGDEVCAIDFSDLVRSAEWGKVYQFIKSKKRWHSLMWQELVLPKLSTYWLKKWYSLRQSKTAPSWILPTYLQSVYTQQAIDQSYQSMSVGGLQQNMRWATASVYSAANNAVYALMNAFFRLQVTSPLQDRRLVDFALSLPPRLQFDPEHGKILLRQVARNHLPPEILWRPKENYFDPMKYAGVAKGDQVLNLLENLKHLELVADIIDITKVEEILTSYRAEYAEGYCGGYPFRNSDANDLYGLFAFVSWYKLIKKYVRH